MNDNQKRRYRRYTRDLLKARILNIEGVITPQMSIRISRHIRLLNMRDQQKEILIYISSEGGRVDAGLKIYRAVKRSLAPVAGIVWGEAHSMACIILQGCHVRKAMKHSTMIVHNINIGYTWDYYESNIDSVLAHTRKSQQPIYKILCERTGRSLEDVRTVSAASKEFIAEDALRFGLIDEII